MLSGIDLFQVAGDRMRYLTERQTLIARNIANADTPGYKAQDLAPFTPVPAPGGTTAPDISPVVLAQRYEQLLKDHEQLKRQQEILKKALGILSEMRPESMP